MVCEVVTFPAMARKVEQRKKAISVTLTAANIESLETLAARMEFKPSISRLIDRAIAEYVERAQTHRKLSK